MASEASEQPPPKCCSISGALPAHAMTAGSFCGRPSATCGAEEHAMHTPHGMAMLMARPRALILDPSPSVFHAAVLLASPATNTGGEKRPMSTCLPFLHEPLPQGHLLFLRQAGDWCTMLKDITAYSHQPPDHHLRDLVQLLDQIDVPCREGAPFGPLLRQRVRGLVGFPGKLGVPGRQGVIQSQVGLDLVDPYDTHDEVPHRAWIFEEVCPQVAVLGLRRGSPSGDKSMHRVDYIGVVDVELDKKPWSDCGMAQEVDCSMQLGSSRAYGSELVG